MRGLLLLITLLPHLAWAFQDSNLRQELDAILSLQELKLRDSSLSKALAFEKKVDVQFPDSLQIQFDLNKLLGELYIGQNVPQLAQGYFQDAIQTAERLNSKDSLKIAHTYRGYAYTFLLQNQFEEAHKYYNLAQEISEARFGKNHLEVSPFIIEKGVAYYRQFNMEEALRCWNQGLEIYLDQNKEDSLEVGRLHLRFSAALFYLDRFPEALGHLKKARANYWTNGEAQNVRLGSIELNTGNCYLRLEEYELSYEHFKKAMEIFKATVGANHMYYADAIHNMGHLKTYLGDYEEAIDLYNHADSIKTLIGQNIPIKKGRYYLGIAEAFLGNKEYEKALRDYKNGLATFKDIFGPKSIYIIETNFEIAETYLHIGEYQKGIALYKEHIDLLDEIEYPNNFTYGRVYFRMGSWAFKNKDFKLSLEYLDNSLKYLGLEDWAIENNNSYKFQWFAWNIYHQKALTHFAIYKKTANQDNLKAAMKAIVQATSMLDYVRLNYSYMDSKLRLQENNNEVYQLGTQIALALNDPELAFSFSEQNKSQVLFEAITKNKTQAFLGVSPEFLEQEKANQVELTFLETKLYEESKEGITDSIRQGLEQQISNLRLKIAGSRDLLALEYPQYFNLRYNNQAVKLKEAQGVLPDDQTAIVEYFIQDTSLILFVIQREHVSLIETPIPTNFLEVIDSLRLAIQDYNLLIEQPQKAKKLYSENAHTLYEILLKEGLSKLSSNIQNLIIIPDGKLGYIPFAILLDELPDNDLPYKDYPYLLKKYAIQYAYSAKMIQEQKVNEVKPPPYGLAGFAPQYEQMNPVSPEASGPVAYLVRSHLLPLPGAQKEVEAIANLVNGHIFTGPEATRQKFEEVAPDYRILHLSMHALLEDQNPLYSKLMFSTQTDSLLEGAINLSELFNMELNADLAVLSACNTGYGEVLEGEGMLSLSRAFAYAGVPSTVMSLWKVPDESTSQIMIRFYKNLKSGMAKHQALQHAKLDYLEETIVPEFQHPVFWAGFIGMGNTMPVELDHSTASWVYWLFGGLFILIALGVLYYRAIKK